MQIYLTEIVCVWNQAQIIEFLYKYIDREN